MTEVFCKSHYGNCYLQMIQNPITVTKHSGFPQWKDSIGCEEICDYRINKEDKNFHSVLS